LAETLEKEAKAKIRQNHRQFAEVEQNISPYNQAVELLNACLGSMQLARKRLPVIDITDLAIALSDAAAFAIYPDFFGEVESFSNAHALLVWLSQTSSSF
jgi:hypothetical protein